MDVKTIKKSTVFIITSQILTIIANVIKTLLIPIIIISIEEYANWQIYLFYLSYILISSLGFNDGIYLRYTGQTKEKIDKSKSLYSSAKLHLLITAVITIVSIILIDAIIPSSKKYIYMLICANMIPMEFIDINLRIYQSKFEMKSFAIYNVIDKILFIVSIIALLLFVKVDSYALIAIDLIIKIIICICLYIKNRNSWRLELSKAKEIAKEWLNNVRVGAFILISSYLLILISGIGRIVIEHFGNTEEYATYSLALSITNIISLVINSVGIIVFPVFKTLGKRKSLTYANYINKLLLLLTPIVLLCYYPFSLFINTFLPKYSASAFYLIFTIPMTIIKCFSSLTYVPLIKSQKKEGELFINSIISLVGFSIICIPIYFLTKDADTIIIGTLSATYLELLLDSKTLLFNIRDIIEIGVIIIVFIILELGHIAIIVIPLLILLALILYKHNNKDYRKIATILRRKPKTI